MIRHVSFQRSRKAFTMLELIFVMVILGIVASIGSEIIVKVYENYVIQRGVHRASIKTELAAQQIANLLRYRIPQTAIARDPDNLSTPTASVYVTDQSTDHDYKHTILEWIGADADSFNTATPPGWSGFCDVNASDQTKVITPGSQLTLTQTIMNNLSKNAAGTSTAQRPIIFFRHSLYSYNSTTGASKLYTALGAPGNPACLGMVSADRSCISQVDITNNTKLTFNSTGSATQKVIAEHYKLAWSAYAIIPYKSDDSGFCTPGSFTASGEVHCDLKLFYNYQPWEGERLDNTLSSIPRATLVRNVTVFKFAEAGGVFRFKICAQESYGSSDYNTTICKEKAVLR